MCEPASMIVTRERVLWLPESDKHEDILKHYKLHDGVSGGDFVRVEINPPGGYRYDAPLAEWVFRTDQRDTPEWYNAEWAETIVREELPKWMTERTITENRTIMGGVHFVLVGAPTITLNGGEVRTRATSAPTITVNGGVVRTWDTSAPKITDNRKKTK